jgi:uncharacterized protein DUF3788
MLANAFIGKSHQPSDRELAEVLGSSAKLWNQLVSDLARENGVDTQEWTSLSKKYGWSLRLKLEKRNIVYLSPHSGCFTASFALGDRAIHAARAGGLPVSVIKLIDEAKRYAEGTGVRIDVKGAKDIAIVKKLAAIKLQN